MDPIKAITESLPPATDYLTYLTILESHLSISPLHPDLLPTLNRLLQADENLTINIGWDLVAILLPLPGAESCLLTIARTGNPREVILKVVEAFHALAVSDDELRASNSEPDDTDDINLATTTDHLTLTDTSANSQPTKIEKYTTLLSVLTILHSRIKTSYPSRFLSTSLVAILSAYVPN